MVVELVRAKGRFPLKLGADDEATSGEGPAVNSRERVLSAFSHQEPDRVPCWCGSSPEFWTKAKRVLGLDDEGLRRRLGDDFRRVYGAWRGPEAPLIPRSHLAQPVRRGADRHRLWAAPRPTRWPGPVRGRRHGLSVAGPGMGGRVRGEGGAPITGPASTRSSAGTGPRSGTT